MKRMAGMILPKATSALGLPPNTLPKVFFKSGFGKKPLPLLPTWLLPHPINVLLLPIKFCMSKVAAFFLQVVTTKSASPLFILPFLTCSLLYHSFFSSKLTMNEITLAPNMEL